MSAPPFLYQAELIKPLDDFYSSLAPPRAALMMHPDDFLSAAKHIEDGWWSSMLEDEYLPQFQQDNRHLAFCREFFDDDASEAA